MNGILKTNPSERPIKRTLDELNDEIGALENTIDNLYDRLSPVASSMEGLASPRPTQNHTCEFDAYLRVRMDRIIEARLRLANLLDALQL